VTLIQWSRGVASLPQKLGCRKVVGQSSRKKIRPKTQNFSPDFQQNVGVFAGNLEKN